MIPLSDGSSGSGHLFLKTPPNSFSSVNLFILPKGDLAQQDFYLMLYQFFLLFFPPSGNPLVLFLSYVNCSVICFKALSERKFTQPQPFLLQKIRFLLGQRRNNSRVICCVHNIKGFFFCFHNTLILLNRYQNSFKSEASAATYFPVLVLSMSIYH